MKKNASEKQYEGAIRSMKDEFRHWEHIRTKSSARIDGIRRELEGSLKKVDSDDN